MGDWRMLGSAGAGIKIGHALAARSEMRILAEELGELIRESGVPTPSIDILNRHLDPQMEPLPDGSSKIRVRWSALGLLVASAALVLEA